MSDFIFNAKTQRGKGRKAACRAENAAITFKLAETFNIQHSTPNGQVFPVRTFIECWALNVEC
jgi:hypothetical protein